MDLKKIFSIWEGVLFPAKAALRYPVKMGKWRWMKTTLEIPDALFRQAKSAATEQGIPLRELVSEALVEKLRARRGDAKPWMKTFGKLRSLRKETARINRIIEAEFGPIEPEDWQRSRTRTVSPPWRMETSK